MKAGKDRLAPSVYGIGFMGEGRYKASINYKTTRQYETWKSMMRRCYSSVSLKARPTYRDCTVCDEWHNFQNFAKWFDNNYIKGYELDKDIKVNGNKTYSPCTCMFVSPADNMRKAVKNRDMLAVPLKSISKDEFKSMYPKECDHE